LDSIQTTRLALLATRRARHVTRQPLTAPAVIVAHFSPALLVLLAQLRAKPALALEQPALPVTLVTISTSTHAHDAIAVVRLAVAQHPISAQAATTVSCLTDRGAAKLATRHA